MCVKIVVAFSLALLGCNSTEGAATGPQPPGASDSTASLAYFVLQDADIAGPAWPDSFRKYDTIVVNPSIDSTLLATAFADLPRTTFLAYVDAQNVRERGPNDSRYWRAFWERFDSRWLAVNLDTGAPIHLYPEYPKLVWYVLEDPVTDMLVAWIRDRVMPVGFDGVYLDNLTQTLPDWEVTQALRVAARIDIDDDGVADPPEVWRTRYAAKNGALSARLRLALPNAILIGNAGTGRVDPALNGITLEEVGGALDAQQSRAIFLAQRAVSRSPVVSIAWIRSARALAAARDMGLPFVRLGKILGGPNL